MNEPKWMTRLENRVGALAVASHRNPVMTLLAVLAVTVAGFWGSTKLTLNADLTGLLPRSFQSVQDLEALQKRFGGIGYVVVVGEGAEPEALRRFASDMAPQLEKLEGIRFVEFQRATLFFRDRAAYYMSLADLEEIDRRIAARRHWEVAKQNPLLIQIEDEDEEPAPSLDFSDIEAKYRQGANARLAGDEPFYIDEEKRMIMLLLKPEGLSVDLGFAKEISQRVRSFMESKDLSEYPNLKISYTGTFQKKIDQQNQITRDVATAGAVAFVLILLYLAFHFRGALGVGYVLMPVGAGLLWTYGLVALFYGQVNILTAFLGAILGGLGAEHGLHLVGRYLRRRAEGMASEEATKDAFSHSGGSALISSLVGAITFMSLAISEFRAFREFGVIAGFGMMVVVLACLVTIPALIGLAARLGWKPRPTKAAKEGQKTPLASAIVRFARPLALVASLALVLLACLVPRAHFDFDFEALQDSNLPSYQLDRELNRIRGYSQTPVALLADKPGEERFIVEQVLKRKAELGDMSTVDFVGSLEDLVPEQQLEKRAVLEKIGQALERFNPEALEPKLAKQFDDFVRMSKAMPFAQGDIPIGVRRQFEGADGKEGGFVFIYPSVDTSDGQNVLRLAKEARNLQRADGSTVSAAGENMILADILEMVYRESYWVLAAAIFFVILALWLTLGSLKTALICLAPTILSVVALVGLLPLVGLHLNILNMIALPVLIGTTVDGAVHLYSRFQEWEGRFQQVYSMTGRAIIGGLITSAIGFGAMMLADHPGLRSLGTLTVMGFGINALVMLLWFPACLILLRRKEAQ